MKLINKHIAKGYLLLPPFWKQKKFPKSGHPFYREKKSHDFCFRSPFTLKADVIFSVPKKVCEGYSLKTSDVRPGGLVGFSSLNPGVGWILEIILITSRGPPCTSWKRLRVYFCLPRPKSELQQCHTIDRSPWKAEMIVVFGSLWGWMVRESRTKRLPLVLFAV